MRADGKTVPTFNFLSSAPDRGFDFTKHLRQEDLSDDCHDRWTFVPKVAAADGGSSRLFGSTKRVPNQLGIQHQSDVLCHAFNPITAARVLAPNPKRLPEDRKRFHKVSHKLPNPVSIGFFKGLKGLKKTFVNDSRVMLLLPLFQKPFKRRRGQAVMNLGGRSTGRESKGSPSTSTITRM
ncbi:hypothetical protein AK812_SmicGene23722 [Symbiodinium microadriaticum]|uniref:Uncharacterized protein n=1 Tax=Symbiodinium microadriaticum TaxID=2951 RepID=A0A1Q9DGG8_SYMMI|nr:hypothetical protein AK812_SmicGene23722 [Symbiodinium microadriaticum]